MSRIIRPQYSLVLIIFLFVPFLGFSLRLKPSALSVKAESRLKKMDNIMPQWRHLGRIRPDSLTIEKNVRQIHIYFSPQLSYIPIREPDIATLEKSVKKALGWRFRKYKVILYSDHHMINELIPNAFRSIYEPDKSRIFGNKSGRIPVVKEIGKEQPISGLYNNNIALWDSHGWYYESKQDRWKWQRARLFGTVEDMSPMSYILPYVVPMLENSGANVFLPRERDWQTEEIIVDNDRSSEGSDLLLPPGIMNKKSQSGFLMKDTLFCNDNPFLLGTSLNFSVTAQQEIKFIPAFKTKGRYSVSVSYHSDSTCLTNAVYTVNHAGGKTQFYVNQKIGGGTWIYLGTFNFREGKNPDIGMVTLTCRGVKNEATLSVDAVKFGGGTGNIARGSISDPKSGITTSYKLSGKARYLEGARYYMQSAGFPDTLTYSLNKNTNDYNDDYQSRGEWINYLLGMPNGPEKNRSHPGLSIPVDVSLAFHTDAGITPNDSIIGTLGIYSTKADGGIFPNGKSRLASRDLSDMIQTQVVDDIRRIFNPNWTRRGLWDKPYSEAWRPNVPAFLLELFSHQNIADMRFGLDPRFRFIVSRAIYKGILKFLAYQESRAYVVHPLPVDHFSIVPVDSGQIKLSWRAVLDPSEDTSKPDKFRVYKRIDDGGFDNGILVSDTALVLKSGKPDGIYSFKVSAVNDGGESFTSEILSYGLKTNSKGNVLVVNGFDRICGPTVFDNERMSGVEWWKDHGVGYLQDISFVGDQYDFNRDSKWLDDDSPGWGASYGNMEGKIIPGNSFDYTYVHGKAIMAAGYSFFSSGLEAFCESATNCASWSATDVILGKERRTQNLKQNADDEFLIYTPAFKSKISELTSKNGNLILSGAYLGSEFGESKDTLTADFVKKILHFTWRTGHASKGGGFYATDYVNHWFKGNGSFNMDYDPEIYSVDAPDGIEPSGKNAFTAFRYSENNVSAGILYKGKSRIVAIGFPIECIKNTQTQHSLIKQIFGFFESK